MQLGKKFRITNIQRQQQKNNQKQKIIYSRLTPPKSVYRKHIYFKIQQKAEKFGYDFETGQSKTLKQMKKEFEGKAAEYYGRQERPRVLKNKDKYQRNLQLGKPFKKNPLLKIFNKVENKMQQGDKLVAFEKIRRYAF